jgi:hypothetical protein
MMKHSAQWWANALDVDIEKKAMPCGWIVFIKGNPCYELTALISDVDTMEKVVHSQMIGGRKNA